MRLQGGMDHRSSWSFWWEETYPFLLSPTHFLSQIPPGNYRCGNRQCLFTYKTHWFKPPHSGKINIKDIISCKTKSVIYMLKCLCGLWKKIKQEPSNRIREHRTAICNHNASSPVVTHFAKACIINPPSDTSVLRHSHTLLRETLGTLAPRDLNEDLNISPFLWDELLHDNTRDS